MPTTWLLTWRIYTALKGSVKTKYAQRLKPFSLAEHAKAVPSSEVSIIVPTVGFESTIVEAANSWCRNRPKEIIFVTVDSQLNDLRALLSDGLSAGSVNVRILTVPEPGKRKQLVNGIQHATGSILVLADDDVYWPPDLLRYFLACFQNPAVGGVGGKHEVFKPACGITLWQRLADERLRRRNRDVSFTNYLDETVACLSGRTAAYRAHILRDQEFQEAFTNDRWRGKFLLDSGDDVFITRWAIRKGWRLAIQVEDRAKILTRAAVGAEFLIQMVRWKRNSLRSQLRFLLFSRELWQSHPRLMCIMVESIVSPILEIIWLWRVLEITSGGLIMYCLCSVLFAAFERDVQTALEQILLQVLGLYAHFYALATLHVTTWGTRELHDGEVLAADSVEGI